MENDSDWRVQGEVRLWMGVRSELLPGPPRPAGLSLLRSVVQYLQVHAHLDYHYTDPFLSTLRHAEARRLVRKFTGRLYLRAI